MSTEYEYKLSVVVLVYNAEYYLEECLNSLVNQTLDGIEIICVNDESTDNSLNILNRYARKYDNIKIINQKNQGGAIAGNNGLKHAKGEYVTLVDSDDIVVKDAYEKLYNKAKETGSDIVGGKPNIYLSGYQREISHKHNIWLEERTIDPSKDIDIYYDVFYWDKIYKRSLIEEHDIYMIPGKLYADAPLVFKAYLYAKKITIIPDFIYYWRKRSTTAITKGNSYTSITKSLLDLDNMHDRLVTYYYLKDYFKQAGKEDIFEDVMKIYFERFFYPINGILKDENFKNGYLKELKPILEDIPNIYDNDLRIIYNLYTYFILNDEIEALEDFINFHKDDKDLLVEGDKVYWNIKYFRNPEYKIPDELFEIDYIFDKFIEIESIESDKEFFYINNIKIPDNIEIDQAQAVLIGLTKKCLSRFDDIIRFDLERIEEGRNQFNAKIPIKNIKNINIYDVYLKFKYNDRDELFRISENNFKNLDKNNIKSTKTLIPYFSSLGNCSIVNAYKENFFRIEADEEKIKIYPDSIGDINYKLAINYKKSNQRVNFKRQTDGEKCIAKNELELKWKYSVDMNMPYNLYMFINRRKFKLTVDYFKNFKNQDIEFGEGIIHLHKRVDNAAGIDYKKK